MTLVPLAALVVVLGLFPGLLLGIINQLRERDARGREPRRPDRVRAVAVGRR